MGPAGYCTERLAILAAGAGLTVACFAVAETIRESHIPMTACPGTPQRIRNRPGLLVWERERGHRSSWKPADQGRRGAAWKRRRGDTSRWLGRAGRDHREAVGQRGDVLEPDLNIPANGDGHSHRAFA